MASPEPANGASTSTLDPLAGKIGHLSPEQESRFVEFKAACEKDGVYHRGRGDPVSAMLCYCDICEPVWREANKLDELYDTFDVDTFEEARKVVLSPVDGKTRPLRPPVYVYEISHIKNHIASFEKSSTILKTASTPSASDPIPGKLRMLCALYENMSELVLPLCNAIPNRPNPETPVSTTSHIVDISNVGLMQFWNLKGHMQAASTLATAHYPETLDRLFILGAPSFFPTVWGWIKRWFDPVTTSKIFILSAAEVQPTLTRFMRPADLPKKYGGELEWEYGMPPSVDGDIVRAVQGLAADKWVRGPLRWVQEPGGSGKVVARGTMQGKERNEVVGVLDGSGSV
ncbi:CRAL-TRIO domain-containing protein [Mycena sp. CBHHK59/15]|nr:CRAL-TRIO domain-containing protein [Mycena sp. CBHHK59/15]